MINIKLTIKSWNCVYFWTKKNTMRVRLTKEFGFETAHALDGYHGKCKDIHGHSYHLKVTILGSPKKDPQASDCGMVMDFGDLKDIVREHVVKQFDHHLILRKDSRFKGIEEKNERMRYVDYQPTCENMLLEIVDIILQNLPEDIHLHSAHLRETATSYAEWHSEDNAR